MKNWWRYGIVAVVTLLLGGNTVAAKQPLIGFFISGEDGARTADVTAEGYDIGSFSVG